MSKILFQSVGTKSLGVGYTDKMGSTTLKSLVKLSKNKLIQSIDTINSDTKENNKIYVVLIRDVLDKWKSGYIQELVYENNIFRRNGLRRFFENGCFESFQNNRPETKKTLEVMTLLHEFEGLHGTEWMYRSHACFWRWNKEGMSLRDYTLSPNIYFLDLEDLSNPKFLEWLQEKDEKWKVIKQIKPIHFRSKERESIKSQIDNFWNEYNSSEILKDKVLISPMVKDSAESPWRFMWEMHNQQQIVVDDIRDNHERYLRFR